MLLMPFLVFGVSVFRRLAACLAPTDARCVLLQRPSSGGRSIETGLDHSPSTALVMILRWISLEPP